MATYSSFKITQAGLDLQYKTQAGKSLKFTKFKLGSGSYNGNIRDLTELVKVEKEEEITRFSITGVNDTKKLIIGFDLNNAEISTGFYLREIGIYAEDPDTNQEVLMFYTNAGDSADYIAPNTSSTALDKLFNAEIYISDVENITANIDTSMVYVSQKDFNSTTTTINQSIEDLQTRLTTKVNSMETIYVKDYTLEPNVWMNEVNKGKFVYTIQASGITENHRVNLYMDLENQDKLTDGYTDTITGFIHIYTSEKPTENVIVNLEIQPVKQGTISK